MSDYDRIRSFYDQHRAEQLDDPDFLRGTVEDSPAIARFRFRAEARHLGRILPVRPGARVLDLGGGTGRWALWFARRGAQVTVVELAPSLVAGAVRNAARSGLPLRCHQGSILDPPLDPQERFDIVHIGGVLVYVEDADLPRVAAVARQRVAPGGRLVVREPVDPAGPSRDVREGGYEALFRRPEVYVELFGSDFELVYAQTTVSHLVPRGRDTRAVVAAVKASGWRRRLVEAVLPSVGFIDYHLLQLELRLRASALRGLLGDPGVVQRFYVWRAHAARLT